MKFQELTSESEVLDLIEYHNRTKEPPVLDLETTGLDVFKDRIIDIGLTGFEPDSAVLFGPEFLPLLLQLQVPLILQNFKYDFNMAYRQGIDLRVVGLEGDVMLLDHLLDDWVTLEPERAFHDKPCKDWHSLDSIVKRRYGNAYKEEFWSKYKTYQEAPRDEQVRYACADIVYERRAYQDIRAEIKHAGIPDELVKHVHQLALTLYQTEITGIKLDLDYLRTMGDDLTLKIQTLKKDMRTLVDTDVDILECDYYLEKLDKRKTDKGKANVKKPEFNFDSNEQLGDLLYNRLKLPIQRNKERNRTVGDGALKTLEPSHPLVGKLREYRGHQKVFTAYIQGSLDRMHHGRIYPSFNVNGTVTGRLSSSNPNMQQLPKDGGVRGIYIPDPGYKFISCDYKQLEVVIAAHFSRDPNLLKIVHEGASKHDITNEALKLKDRNLAKTINFAMQYLCGWQKIQKLLGCSESEAKHLWNKYWETYAGERRVVDRCISLINEGKPIVTLWGRQRRFPDVSTMNHWERERCYRQGYNALIQGTGADCNNRATYLVNDALLEEGFGKVLFPTHDDNLVTSKDQYTAQSSEVLSTIMINVGKEINLTVPLSVDCSKPMDRWQKG